MQVQYAPYPVPVLERPVFTVFTLVVRWCGQPWSVRWGKRDVVAREGFG